MNRNSLMVFAAGLIAGAACVVAAMQIVPFGPTQAEAVAPRPIEKHIERETLTMLRRVSDLADKLSVLVPGPQDGSQTPVEKMVEPVAKPVAKPIATPVAKPAPQPVVKPVVAPAAVPVVKPVVEPVARRAWEASVTSDLQSVRSQLMLYKIQHLDEVPGEDLVAQFTKRTNMAGAVKPARADGKAYDFGPYLKKWPVNPFKDSAEVKISTDKPGAGDEGWHYNPETGDFSANDAKHKDW